VKPENIFYSSIIDETIQYNELSKLKSFIYSLLNENEDSGERITSATKEVITEHKEFLREQYEDQLLEDDSQGKSDGNTLRSLEEKLTQLNSFEKDFHKQFTEEVNLTLDNAYLMPAQLREHARSFLESQQGDFKVGGFFRVKKRTEDEKYLRLNTF